MFVISRLFWTEEEIEILKEHYEYSSHEKLEEVLPRFTIEKMRIKASQLGIKRKVKRTYKKKGKKRTWSKEEVEKLKKIFSITPNTELTDKFDRSLREINRKANSLDLHKTEKTKEIDKNNKINAMVGDKGWTEKENKIIKKYYPTRGQAGVQKLLPNKTLSAIKTKAERLGLKKSPQASWEKTNISINDNDIFSIKVNYERVDR